MISVCMATYNGEKYIEEQLKSILSQLGENDEVIVSDDSSTDNTLAIVESFNDVRIKIFPNNKFHSPIFNFENALKQATGDYIFLSDQDDVWRENKVKIMMEPLKNGIGLVLSDGIVVNQNLEIVSESIYEVLQAKEGFMHNFIHNSYSGSRMAFSRGLLDIILPFPKQIAMHDIWIGLCAELFSTTIFIPDKTILYRRHDNNVSSTGNKSTLSVKYKILYRAYIAYQLFERWKTLRKEKS